MSGFIGCDASFDDASIVLFGAPFDSTTSYRPGARSGPAAICGESYGIETYSPYQDADLTDRAICDLGTLDLPFGDPTPALDMIERQASDIFDAGKLALMFGGEHLVTLGALRAAVRRWSGLQIIHFDAHADLRDDYLGAKLSHACVMRRAHELVGDGRIHQFCIRSGDRDEFKFADAHTSMTKFDTAGIGELAARLAAEGAPVYLTIDLDCLDPAVLPGTGTPEAGGIGFDELLGAVRCVCGTRVVGADIVELAPGLDASGASTACACKLARELMLALKID